MLEEIAAFEVTVSVSPKNHVCSRDCKHVALELDAVKALFLNVFALLLAGCRRKHAMHGGDEKSRRSACWVKHRICGLNINELTHKVADVLWREYDAECLAVPAGIAHKLAVKATYEVFRSLLVLDAFENVFVKEVRVVVQRGHP